ncbi:MAG: DUF1059 domain-containing protein [Nitrososphaerota archaeon]
MPKVGCKDLGVECGFQAEGETAEQIAEKIIEHAVHMHGMPATAESRERTIGAVRQVLQRKIK